ncbi:MAG: diaminopimelate decarboxylase [Dehalococcoidia bacterium]|nr:diaminopimelate decarboxylase [Dehalococcoidia bacterium]
MNNRITLFPYETNINDANHLVIGGCDAIELAAKYGTPLYLFDELTLRSRCREFKNEFGKRYPNTTVVYAGKAFLHTSLAALLKEEGLGLDVVSGGELHIAKTADFPPERIYFHGNNKSSDELSAALKQQVGRIVVDNIDELRALAALADESCMIQDILLRITPGVDAHTHSHIATGGAGSKFGFPLCDAEEGISCAMSLSGVNLVGLHFHVGSLIGEATPYLDAIDVVMKLAFDAKDKYAFELQELNVGGGYAVPYTVEDKVPEISYYAGQITGRIMVLCQSLNMEPPKLVIEPGRSIVAQSGVALYRVGSIKDVAGPVRYVAVDGGMADNIRPALYAARYEAVLANRMNEENTEQVTIAGHFCESGDILVHDIMLPSVSSGDIIAVPVCGAYCLPMSSNYNAALRPPIVMLSNGRDRLVRRRETYQDITCCDMP